nr:hypothetical protein [Bittarella massiliensis (ex Durand et al. 2017)]
MGVEAVLLDKLCNPALYLGPGHITRRAVHRHREGRQIIAKLLPQPGGGVLFTGVVLHIAHDCVLALNIAVPFLDSRVNLGLGQRPALGRCRALCRGMVFRHRKRTGRLYARSFVDGFYLFRFGEEQV